MERIFILGWTFALCRDALLIDPMGRIAIHKSHNMALSFWGLQIEYRYINISQLYSIYIVYFKLQVTR